MHITVICQFILYKSYLVFCSYKLLLRSACVFYPEWRIMKNRKFVGTLLEQNVRAQSKPWIMEVDA